MRLMVVGRVEIVTSIGGSCAVKWASPLYIGIVSDTSPEKTAGHIGWNFSFLNVGSTKTSRI